MTNFKNWKYNAAITISYIIVGASFPWAGAMWIDGQPFDATLLFCNALIAWQYLKNRP